MNEVTSELADLVERKALSKMLFARLTEESRALGRFRTGQGRAEFSKNRYRRSTCTITRDYLGTFFEREALNLLPKED